MSDGPDRASRASAVPHHALYHAINDEFCSGYLSLESPILSQQWHVAFPSEGGQAALPIGRPAPFLASCGGVSQSATALATVDCSRLPTPRKNRYTSSSTSTRCYLLALGHLYHSLPTLYRCEQPPLPPEGVMPGLMCHTYANVFYSLQLTRTERLGTGSREGRLSYASPDYS